MHKNLGFYATWLPSEAVSVGDVGVLENGRFRRQSSLKELGIPMVEVPAGTLVDVQYASTTGTKINVSAGADVLVVSGEITIDFSEAGAFLFHAMQMRPTRLENRIEVSNEILRSYAIKAWKKEWLLVETVHRAKSATVVISEDGQAGLVISAHAEGALANLPLADPKAKLSVVSTHGRLFHLIGAKDLCPLYSCLRLEDPWLGQPKVQPVRGTGDQGVALSRPSIDELLES
jgi:hypothetical protein